MTYGRSDETGWIQRILADQTVRPGRPNAIEMDSASEASDSAVSSLGGEAIGLVSVAERAY